MVATEKVNVGKEWAGAASAASLADTGAFLIVSFSLSVKVDTTAVTGAEKVKGVGAGVEVSGAGVGAGELAGSG